MKLHFSKHAAVSTGWVIPAVAAAGAVAVAAGAVFGVSAWLHRRARPVMEPFSSVAGEASEPQTTTASATTTVTQTTTQTATAPKTSATTVRTTTTVRKTYPKVTAPKPVAEPSNPSQEQAPRPTQPPSASPMTLERVKRELASEDAILGVDVWRLNADPTPIDWKKVKAAGVTFAIIRVGGRFWGTDDPETSGKIYEDSKFDQNVQGALDAGLQVGVYFFSAAVNEKESLEEAQFVLDRIKAYDITWPVVYDFESFNRGRLNGVSYTTVTDNAIAFMEYVAAAGYTPMLYSSRNMLWNQFETGRLGRYRIWMAQYVNKRADKQYGGEHAIWQCASDGQVDGIRGYVDLNVAYEDLSRCTEPYVKNPEWPVSMDFEATEDAVVCTDNHVGLRLSPDSRLPNRYATAAKGQVFRRIGLNADAGWSKLRLEDGTEVYASNAYLTAPGG